MNKNIEHISIAESTDLPALVSLINTAYRKKESNAWTTEAELFEEGDNRIDLKTLEELQNKPENILLKYTNDNGLVYGSVCLSMAPDAIHLGLLAVAPDIQSKGIGRQLISAAQKIALEKGKKALLLEVISIRTELIHWYERRGFHLTGRKINFEKIAGNVRTKQPLHFVEMVCDLKAYEPHIGAIRQEF